MARIVGGRTAQAIVTLFLATVVAFLFLHAIPGDPALLLAGDSASQADIEGLRRQLGLDRPYYVQYARYLERLLHGDLGQSYKTRSAVVDAIRPRLGPSLQLAVAAIAFAAILGMTLGVATALRPATWMDAAVSTVSLLGVTVPTFWLGLMLILLMSVEWRLLPTFGAGSWQHLVMPAFTLGAAPLGMIARLTRSEMLEVLPQDYIRTARAKGLPPRTVVVKHALRNALLPVVNFIGLQFGIVLGYAVVTETIFAWPGLGRLLVDSIITRDYPMVQGLILLFALIFVGISAVVDLTVMWMDPRIREASAQST